MAGVFHISAEEAARDFGALMERVRAGDEIVVEEPGKAEVRMTPVARVTVETAGTGHQIRGNTAEEILEDLAQWQAEHGPLKLDEDFVPDMEEIHSLYNTPMDTSKWD